MYMLTLDQGVYVCKCDLSYRRLGRFRGCSHGYRYGRDFGVVPQEVSSRMALCRHQILVACLAVVHGHIVSSSAGALQVKACSGYIPRYFFSLTQGPKHTFVFRVYEYRYRIKLDTNTYPSQLNFVCTRRAAGGLFSYFGVGLSFNILCST